MRKDSIKSIPLDSVMYEELVCRVVVGKSEGVLNGVGVVPPE